MVFLELELLYFIRTAYTLMQWPGIVILMAIESACIPLPSEIIMPFAGWILIKDQSLPAIYTLVAGAYGALGNSIGSTIAYGAGMWGGRPFLNKYGKYILISHRDLNRADQWFTRYGSQSIFLSRLLPVVRTFISLPAGIAKMHFVKFVLYTFLGSFIWSAGLAYGGYLLGEHWEQLRTAIRPFDPVLVAIIIVFIAWYIYRHLRHAKSTN